VIFAIDVQSLIFGWQAPQTAIDRARTDIALEQARISGTRSKLFVRQRPFIALRGDVLQTSLVY
jgi:hypothetical protein